MSHFVVNFILMPESKWEAILIDTSIVLLLLIPSLYFFVFKPKKNMHQQLMEIDKSDEKLSLLIANSSIMLFSLQVKDSQLHTEWASENIERLLGYSQTEVSDPDWWLLHIHPQDRGQILAESAVLLEGVPTTCEYRFHHKNGSYIWVHDEQKLEFDEQGNPLNIVSIWTDITGQKMAELELSIAAHTFESREGIMITDAEMNILRVNSTFEKITGFTQEKVVGKTPAILKSGRQDKDYYHEMWQEILLNDFWQGEIWNKRQSGEIYTELLTITAIKDSNEKVINYIGTFHDISDRKAAEEEIKVFAFYDALTSLPNRRLLEDRVNQVITSSSRTKEYVAVMFLDIDRFKELNDNYGHEVGDQLLMEVSARLKLCVRECDTIARFGGDEFVVVVSGLSEDRIEATPHARIVAEKVRVFLAEPYDLIGSEKSDKQVIKYSSSVSIGMTLFSGDEMDIDEILKCADIAMYEAKSSGRNSVCIYDSKM